MHTNDNVGLLYHDNLFCQVMLLQDEAPRVDGYEPVVAIPYSPRDILQGCYHCFFILNLAGRGSIHARVRKVVLS